MKAGDRTSATRARQTWAIWITGVPGSGKTALTRAVTAALRARGTPARVLELDEIRLVVTPTPTYTDAERDVVYRALAYMAKLLTEAGVPVLIDATAHRRAWRELARSLVPAFGEVQLVCPLDVSREREERRRVGFAPSGIYAKSGRPAATVPGVDVPYEPSPDPELSLDTTVGPPAVRVDAVLDLIARLEWSASAALGVEAPTRPLSLS